MPGRGTERPPLPKGMVTLSPCSCEAAALGVGPIVPGASVVAVVALPFSPTRGEADSAPPSCLADAPCTAGRAARRSSAQGCSSARGNPPSAAESTRNSTPPRYGRQLRSEQSSSETAATRSRSRYTCGRRTNTGARPSYTRTRWPGVKGSMISRPAGYSTPAATAGVGGAVAAGAAARTMTTVGRPTPPLPPPSVSLA